jgi:hypothetical protein
VFLYIFLIIGFLFNENSLGGATQDYNHHLHIVYFFKKNIYESLKLYGSGDLYTRNSPFFFILYGILLKVINNLELLRFLNLNILLLNVYFFYKALKIKYFFVSNEKLLLVASLILLSPTYRSLSIWPYPLIYALLFFTIATYYFLKFKYQKKKQFKNACLNVLFMALSSYFTPNFSVFSVFFLFNFIKKYNFSYKICLLILINIILAIPALFFLYERGLFFLTNEVEEFSFANKINITNKIAIISTIIFFHLFPFAIFNLKKLFLSKYRLFLIILIFIFCVIFFDFSTKYKVGGGFFFHLSIFLFNNYLFFYVIFLISLLILNILIGNSISNLLIIILLIPYNTQYSIYHKYFDYLILIIFFLLLENNVKKKVFELKNIFYIYLYNISFLLISILKNFLK